MKKEQKLYKIRNKTTGEFVALGCNHKTTWRSYPSMAINYDSRGVLEPKENFEVVVFTYIETETHAEPLR